MKKYIIIIAIVLIVILGLVILNQYTKKSEEDEGTYKIVTSFYPIYIMTLNITQGAQNIDVSTLAGVNDGCVHDYTLTTNDLKKLEKANVFIQNGLGLEPFMEKLTASYPNMQKIDSSHNITNTIQDEHGINAHIWTSLENYKQQVQEVANQLIKYNPENTEVYSKNRDEYIQKLDNLILQYKNNLETIKNKKVVCLNESFEYFLQEIGVESISVNTGHEESTLSAEQLKNIIDTMKEQEIKAIIIDKQDSNRNAQTIAQETGAKIYQLDSCITGNLDKEAYLNAMDGNLEIIEEL